jgi:serine/threonine protein kinase
MIKIIRQLFDAVADLPADAQRSALEKLTQDRPLIEQVLRICGHARTSDTMISSAISNNANDLTSKLSNELRMGDNLDTWKLIEKIGQGGMGSVFLAERADGHFQQTVAIKVMHGLPTPNATARLAQERQILAGLTHPNIARLFDGGATPNGQPYLVLEYIQGLAIDEFCRTKKLDFLQILDLLLPICDAVAIAHQRLIIHCDIKPSNILVNQAGQPSLLDFGIASLAGEADLLGGTPLNPEADAAAAVPDSDDANQTAHFTQSTMRGNVAVAYTPRYASPEQKASKPISTATDIYSLGRVIEELCELDPAFKESRARGKRLLQLQEVQAIIDKACAAVPAARYGSAQALAADIKNTLRGAKVEAALEVASAVPNYASRKWISQHWRQAGVAIVSLVIISGFTLKVIAEKNYAQVQAANAQAERLTANLARAAAEAAQQETQAAKNDALKQRDAAEGARSVAEDSRKQALFAQDNAVLAQRKAQASQQQAEQERALVVRAKQSTEAVNDFLASIFKNVDPSGGGNRNATAREVVEKAEKRLGELNDIEPEAQAKLFKTLANIHLSFGNIVTGAGYHIKSADAWGVYGDKFLVDRASALIIASVQLSVVDLPKSVALAQQAMALTKPFWTQHPLLHARALNAVLVGMQQQLRHAEAKALIAEIEAIYQSSGGNLWKNDSYISFNFQVGKNQFALGDFVAAEATFRMLVDVRSKQFPIAEGANVDTILELAKTLAQLRRNAEADTEFKRALARGEAQFGIESARVSSLRAPYIRFLIELKRLDEAESQLKLAEAALAQSNPRSSLMASNLVDQAQLAEGRGRYIEAIALQERAATIYAHARGDANAYTAGCYSRIARIYVVLKQFDNARQYAIRAVTMHSRLNTDTDSFKLGAERTLAFVEVADGKPLVAIPILERIMELEINALNVSADSKYATRRDAALAWQAVAEAAEPSATDAARDSARVKAIGYAEAARDIAEKSAGNLSANYKAAVALLARLNEPTKISAAKPMPAAAQDKALVSEALKPPQSSTDLLKEGVPRNQK